MFAFAGFASSGFQSDNLLHLVGRFDQMVCICTAQNLSVSKLAQFLERGSLYLVSKVACHFFRIWISGAEISFSRPCSNALDSQSLCPWSQRQSERQKTDPVSSRSHQSWRHLAIPEPSDCLPISRSQCRARCVESIA